MHADKLKKCRVWAEESRALEHSDDPTGQLGADDIVPCPPRNSAGPPYGPTPSRYTKTDPLHAEFVIRHDSPRDRKPLSLLSYHVIHTPHHHPHFVMFSTLHHSFHHHIIVRLTPLAVVSTIVCDEETRYTLRVMPIRSDMTFRCCKCPGEFATSEKYQRHFDTAHGRPSTNDSRPSMTGTRPFRTPISTASVTAGAFRVRFIAPSLASGWTGHRSITPNSGIPTDIQRQRRFQDMACLFRQWAAYAPVDVMLGAGLKLYPEVPPPYSRELAVQFKH